jgi:hypothetical protein
MEELGGVIRDHLALPRSGDRRAISALLISVVSTLGARYVVPGSAAPGAWTGDMYSNGGMVGRILVRLSLM